VPGGVAGTLSVPRATRILRGIRPQDRRPLLSPRPPAVGFGDPTLRIRTLERKIADLNERIEAEVEASATSLIEIFGIGPILWPQRSSGRGRQCDAFPDQGPLLRLILRYGPGGEL
jgi:hypothetical protein